MTTKMVYVPLTPNQTAILRAMRDGVAVNQAFGSDVVTISGVEFSYTQDIWPIEMYSPGKTVLIHRRWRSDGTATYWLSEAGKQVANRL